MGRMAHRGYRSERYWGEFRRAFALPAIVLAVSIGALAVVAFAVPGGEYSHLVFRLGMAVAILSVLWIIARGFSLTALRTSALIAALVAVLLVTAVGRDTRDRAELADYQTTKRSLAIELEQARRSAVDSESELPADDPRADADAGSVAESLLELTALDARLGEIEPAALVASARTAAERAATRAERATSAVLERDGRLEEVVATVQRHWIETSWTATGAVLFDDLQLPGLAITLLDRSLDAAEQADRAARSARALATDADAQAATAAASAAVASRALELATSAADRLDSVGAVSTDLQAVRAATSEATTAADLAAETADSARQRAEATAAEAGVAVDLAARAAGELGATLCFDSQLSTRFVTSYELAVACGDRLVSNCGADGDVDRLCQPRRAQVLLHLGYLAELVGLQRSAADDAAATLDARISSTQSALTDLATPVSIVDLITDGADRILADALAPITNDDIPSSLQQLGWVLLALVLVVLYRALEVTNDRRRPGPALVSAVDDGSEHAAEQFRVLLGRVHLAEPAPVPGGQVAASTADALKGDHITNTAVKFVAALFQSTAFPEQGVELQVGCREIPRPAGPGAGGAHGGAGEPAEAAGGGDGAKSTELLVRGLERRTGRLLFANDFTDPLQIRAVSKAAYFAAANVLSSGYTTPGWLRWRTTDFQGLRSYHRAVLDRPSDVRGLLEDAVARNPSTGAALVALSNEVSLDGDLVRAAGLALLARQRDERFLTARYRLGVTLSMIAGDPQRYLDDHPDRDELLALLGEHRAAAGDGAVRLLAIAHDELRTTAARTAWWRVVLATWRQRERSYWLRLLRSPDRTSTRASARSAQLLVELRAAHLDPAGGRPTLELRWRDRVVNRFADRLPIARREVLDADGAPSPWMHSRLDRILRSVRYDDAHVRYNAACYLVAAGDLRGAAEQLTASRFARNGGAITLEWAQRDPDLAALRASAWWPEVEAVLTRFARIPQDRHGRGARADQRPEAS